MKNIEEILIPFGFSFGILQDINTLLRLLEKNKISSSDFTKYIRDIKKENFKVAEDSRQKMIEAEKEWITVVPKCPNCNNILSLMPVNTVAANQTGDDHKSLWYCTKCDYERYNNETVKFIYRSLIKEGV